MSEETKSYRLAKVAAECGVGVQTAVEELKKNGFDVEAKPTSKLSEEMYRALLKAFRKDIEVKEEAKQLERTKKEAQENTKPAKTAKTDDKEDITEEEPLIINNAPEQVPVAEKQPKEEEKPAPPPVVEEIQPLPEEKVEEPVVEEPVAKETKSKVKLSGPKVVSKIDLESLSGKGKSDKKEKKEEKPKVVEKEEVREPVPAVVEEPVVNKEPEPIPQLDPQPEPEVVEQPVAKTTEPEVETGRDNIIKPKYEVLQGLKVMGKINLPVEEPKKKGPQPAAPGGGNDERKKRKRKTNSLVSSDNPNLGKDFPKDRFDKGAPGQQNRGPGGGGGGGNRPGGPRDRKDDQKDEITQKEIQDKLKQTLARLNPGKGQGTGSRYKMRKQKRDQHAQNREDAAMELEKDKNTLKVTEFVSANELAKLMNVSVNEVITTCFNMGMMVSINQRLDAEAITILADEFGFDVQFVGADVQESIEEEEDDTEDLEPRPPIVTVMGHVDHGKTSLLDYIRDANIVAGEAGGITQHIGAYEVTLKDGRKITFLDTPGHEAFTAMRARGAKLTDIAIIVVAADDSVMPQTKEAISHAQAANVPMIFAINKIDREGANPERIKEQLSAMNILVEDWGGKFQSQEVSAKKGLNIDLLLDKVLLEAEMLDLKANPDRRAKGAVIEARMEKGRGVVASVMVQTGTLRVGDPMVAGPNYARVRALFNERGQKISEAGPSTPVSVLGFNMAPQAGDTFNVMASEAEAKDLANKRTQILREQGIRTKKHITLDEIGRRLAIGNFKELNVVVKADVDGSAEALSDALLKLSTPEIQVNIIYKGVGQISESDINLAIASDAIVVGFQVRPSAQARRLAEQETIEIKLYSIIYAAIEEVKSAMEGMLAPSIEEKIVANVDVRDVFKISKVGTIAGCMVTDGKITRNTKIRVIRDGVVIHTGELDSLKRFKDDVKEVNSGYECGLSIKNFNDIQVGDTIEGFEEVEVKRKL